MTELVRLVRGADAVLHASTRLESTLHSIPARIFGVRGSARDALLTADSMLATAADLVRPTSDQVAESIVQARGAVADVRAGIPSSWRPHVARTEPVLDQLGSVHAEIVDLLDAAPAIDPAGADASTWQRAAQLVRGGIELPDRLRRSGIAVLDSHPAAPFDARAGEALSKPYGQMRARDLADLARIARQLDELDAALVEQLSGLDTRSARQLDRAARLLADGIELPAGWQLRPRLSTARGRLHWPTRESATQRLRELLWWPSRGDRTLLRDDLDAIRHLAPARRPDLVERIPAGVEDVRDLDPATLRELRRAVVEDPARADRLMDLRDAIDRLQPILARPRSNAKAELEAIRDSLQALDALELPPIERDIANSALELVRRNLQRQAGNRVDGYGRWTDLAELGRIDAAGELLDRFETRRLLDAHRVTPGTGTSIAADAAVAADDVLSW